jgi:hypothetical protein
MAVDTNLGWKGASEYVAIVPQIFDLWADPQERHDVFMNTEHAWIAPVMQKELQRVMQTFIQYPPRKLQSEGYVPMA